MDLDFPRFELEIEQIIESKTRWVLSSPENAVAYIIHSENNSLYEEAHYKSLTKSVNLTDNLIDELSGLLLNPKSYDMGKYRRYLGKPSFAFQLKRDDTLVDILVALYNPTWYIRCGKETRWNWVERNTIRQIIKIAKQLFPQYASQHPNSVWRKGAIATLKKELDEKN